MTMLEDLRRTRRSRNVGTVVAVAAVVVTASVVSLSLFDRGENAPAAPGATSPTVLPSSGSGDACADPDITCLSDERYKVAMTVPVTLTVPATFERGRSTASATEPSRTIATTWTRPASPCSRRATAVKDDAAWSADPAAGQSAHAMATWLLHRPFLVDATMTRTNVGGLEAWRVSATLKPGAHLPAAKAGAGFLGRPDVHGRRRQRQRRLRRARSPATTRWSTCRGRSDRHLVLDPSERPLRPCGQPALRRRAVLRLTAARAARRS